MFGMSGIGTHIRNITRKNDIYDYYLGNRDELSAYFGGGQIIDYNAKIYGYKEQLRFPYRKLEKSGILHCPHYNIPLLYRGTLAVTIHDITHIKFPQYLPGKLALYYAKFMINQAVKKSKIIFTVSENTKSDLISHFNADPNKISVVYNAVSPMFKPQSRDEYTHLHKKYSIPADKRVLLYVGNKKPHKNLERLLHAFAEIRGKHGCVLIMAGKGFDNYKRLEAAAEELRLSDDIIHTGVVSDDDLVSLYNLADALVFPSLYEGFGIPPLEAMSCGTPVVCSNASSLPEVTGDAAQMTDPYDTASIADGIDKVLSDENLRKRLIAGGFERVKLFSWDAAADKIRNTLNSLKYS
jgi:glycosyltransferase involved in cell wall biosynthesis